jgi:hypothetical protein
MATMTPVRHKSGADLFAEDICRLHDRLEFRGLPDAITGEPLHCYDTGDGLLTFAVRDGQIPERYLRGILGFRFAQYIRLGWISRELVYRRALYHEPLRPPTGVPDVHVLSLCLSSGKIRGYVGLAGSKDPAALPLDAPERHRYATEVAHDIDMLAPYARPQLTTHRVFEVKRFLRDQNMGALPLAALVPWHIVLGFGRSLLALGGPGRDVLAIGDAKEHIAMRHLRLMGLDLDVIHGTSPRLARDDINWPIYDQEVLAKPFIGQLPATYADDMDLIDSFLTEAKGRAPVRDLVAALVRRRSEVGP